MTAGRVTLVMGVVVGAAAFGGPTTGQVPHTPPGACAHAEDWETDAQALADALDGASGADARALLQELEGAGFVPGGRPGGDGGEGGDTAPPDPGSGGWPDALVELVLEVVAALDGDGDGDGEVPVTVLDPSGAAGATPRTDSGSAAGQECSDRPGADPAPEPDPAPQPDPIPQPDPDTERSGRDEGADEPTARPTERAPTDDEPGTAEG